MAGTPTQLLALTSRVELEAMNMEILQRLSERLAAELANLRIKPT